MAELTVAVSKRDYLLKKMKDLLSLTKVVKTDSSQLGEFQARLEHMENNYVTFEALCDRINQLKLSAKPTDAISYDEWKEYESIYYKIKAFAKTYLPVSESSSSNSFNQNDSSFSSKINRPRLPEITLPTWDSSFKNWPTFYDKFRSLIHDNESLNAIDKFQYLLAAVSGPALANTRGTLPITGENYQIVWTALVKKYQDKRVLGIDVLERILNFPPQTKESVTSLNNFLEQFGQLVSSLKALNIADLSNFILLHIGLQRLPISTRKLFEQDNLGLDIPSFDQLITFVQNQVKILEVSVLTKTDEKLSPILSKEIRVNPLHKSIVKRALVSSTNSSKSVCAICSMDHSIYRCPKYTEMTPYQRRARIRSLHYCFNCLRPHAISSCPSKRLCHCGQKHHSSLHLSDVPDSVKKYTHPENKAEFPQNHTETTLEPVSTNHHSSINEIKISPEPAFQATVLLGTAVVHIRDSQGLFQPIRVLIDSGAQTSIITTACVQKLGLPIRKYPVSIAGLGKITLNNIRGITSCVVKPRISSEPLFNADAVVMSEITSDMPSTQIPSAICQKFKHLVLADPKFDCPSKIDFLVAADIFPQIFDGPRFSIPGGPSALHSIFGWVITGKIESFKLHEPSQPALVSSLLTTFQPCLDESLKRFWECEEPPRTVLPNPEDDRCEKIFSTLHYRDERGRYVVPLPFRNEHPLLPPPAASYDLALNRLRSSERRLSKNSGLKHAYANFLEEYENLDHMERVTCNSSAGKYFIPHHPVIRAGSTSNIRVVFDASCKPFNYSSLNQLLLTGPKLQLDISIVITRFRFHKHPLVCDMRKMFRQIILRPEDRIYQHILWRPSPQDDVQEFELKTVTYGLVPAPYLAIRSIHQLVHDDGATYPLASTALLKDTYVDNIVTGASSRSELLKLKTELEELTQRGGIELHKWSTDDASLLCSIPEADREPSLSFDRDDLSTVNILGLNWQASSDSFSYNISSVDQTCTKRAILSYIARIYDPLGWLCPVVFKAKLMIQHLWRLGLGWDEIVPVYLQTEWKFFTDQLSCLSQVRIPRFLSVTASSHCVLVGFCDASERGYGAALYLRIRNNNHAIAHLLIAKTKVSPLKTLSIPRLELCGALLLCRLFKQMLPTLEDLTSVSNIFAFTDSTTVLSWLKTSPHLLKTYVATRVTEILETLSPSSWYHISSSENPADCASRGLQPKHLLDHTLWWAGPSWLTQPISTWPITKPKENFVSNIPELKDKSTLQALILTESSHLPILFQFSSFTKLQRVVSWIYRFVNNVKRSRENRIGGPLTCQEISNSILTLVRRVQEIHFSDEIKSITLGKPCSPSIQSLAPFIDSEHFLRVGGRLTNFMAPPSKIHPLLLPKTSQLSLLLIDHYHLTYLHVGPRTLQSLLCQKYWIISVRNLIRSRLAKCNICHRIRTSEGLTPLMADLPRSRVVQGRPFINIAIDFGGPFNVKESRRRGAKILKCYLCLIVCLATKAIHLEIVSDLSTDAFVAALSRFVSRRGICHSIYSDCGTNFVGAKRYLSEIHSFLSSNSQGIADALCSRGIIWNLNTPSSPHMNGLAEAGIRSVKFHLKRVVGDLLFTFEEMFTLFCKIESILNSRPLCALSSDPTELDVLTPGHFLIGSSLVAIPEKNFEEIPMNRLNRWQLIQKTSQYYWRIWSRDYLHTLQQRSKWTTSKPNIKVGDLVVVIEDKLAIKRWIMGRVEDVYPGKDGVVRVAKIRTSHGTYLRPVVKLSPLPSQ